MVAREEALTKQAEILRQSLRGLSGGEAEYARLQREVDSQRSLHAMLSDKLTAARIREQGEMKVVKVIDPPGPAVPAGNEKRMLALAVAFAAALGLGAAVPTGVEWLHRKIENEDDVELATGLPVLALVPRIRTGRPVFMSGIPDTTGRGPSDQLMFTEAFRALRVAIELSTRGEPLKRLLVTSAFAGEGKSTVVANLGYALNEAGHRVVLADTDFLRPTLHRTMKIKSSKGLGGDPRIRDSVGADARPGDPGPMARAARGVAPPALAGAAGGLEAPRAHRRDVEPCRLRHLRLVAGAADPRQPAAGLRRGRCRPRREGRRDGVPRPGEHQGACSRAPAPGCWAWC